MREFIDLKNKGNSLGNLFQTLNLANFWATVCKTVRPMLWVLSLSLSVCDIGLLWPNGWMDQDETGHGDGGTPWPRPHCVRFSHHIVAQRANRYIVAFHLLISRYRTICSGLGYNRRAVGLRAACMVCVTLTYHCTVYTRWPVRCSAWLQHVKHTEWVYTNIQPVVKPVWQPAVSRRQPVVKPVVQRVWQPVVSCEWGMTVRRGDWHNIWRRFHWQH